MKAKRPKTAEWAEVPSPPPGALAFVCGTVLVTSELIVAKNPDRDMHDGDAMGPQWLISISAKGGKRPKPHQVRKALRAFGMVGAEEDNHHPGIARHFFLVVDPAHRVDCECKSDETNVLEPDGYKWTNPECAKCGGSGWIKSEETHEFCTESDPGTVHEEAVQVENTCPDCAVICRGCEYQRMTGKACPVHFPVQTEDPR